MISVVIPTMFSHDLIYKTLIQLSVINEIGEIVLIDNSNNNKEFKINKLNHVLNGKNIYVNAAWNQGVDLCKYNKICLLNDDIYFDWFFFEKMSQLITKDIGFIGMHKENFSNWQDETMFFKEGFTFQSPPYHPMTKRGWRTEMWGSCIFFDKNNWDPIPDNLKIWAGDDWLFYRSQKPNFLIHGLKCFGTQSATINKLNIDHILKEDMSNMLQWIKNGFVDNYLIGTPWWKD